MKNIPIKFRGKDNAGQLVYGDLLHTRFGGTLICFSDEKRFYQEVYVAPNSIAQLVGYDVDGEEIYEGDTVTDFEGHKYTATLESRVEWEGTHTVSEFWTLPFEKVEDIEVNRTMPLELWKKFERQIKTKSWLKKEEADDEEHSN